MSRSRRLLLYVFTAFLTCVVWLDAPARSAQWWVAPLTGPVVHNKGDVTHKSGQTKENSTDTHSKTYEEREENNSTAQEQEAKAWEEEQRRRKVVLRTACRQWLPKASEYLPKKPDDLQYLLVDDRHKAIYCFVPKVGCTNWKRLWMILTGLSKEKDPLDIPEEVPHLLHHRMMLVNQHHDPQVLQHKLDTYKKLMVVRDPYERLLSAYRDKLEGGKNRVYQEMATKNIKTRLWGLIKAKSDNVTFPEFVNFVTGLSEPSNFDEHWRPYHKLCFPCAIHYDVIAKYETLTADSNRFLRLIGAPKKLQFPPYVPGNTSCVLPQYMNTLTQAQSHKLFKVYHQDFEAFEYQPFGEPD